MINPLVRAQLVIEIEQTFRTTLRDTLASLTTDPVEQDQIASAVLATMLRSMYRQNGQPWLEAVLRMVLQPVDTASSHGSSSST